LLRAGPHPDADLADLLDDFITLMLPLEVRIVPTYAVAANALSPLQTILDATGLTGLIATVSGIEVSLQWTLLNS
jgi:sn-glycerol 3-phosphate transport system permease protein